MEFLSRLFGIFGGTRKQRALQARIKVMCKFLEDEDAHLHLLPEPLQHRVKAGPEYDQDPNGMGPLGRVETNPIPVNGPIGAIAYLSKLETGRGERILFHRIGSIRAIDAYEAVTFSGSEWFILFVDPYHPRRSRLTPDGFRFTQQLPQFSGCNALCLDFPHDFPAMKEKEGQSSGLGFAYVAYVPVFDVSQQIQDRAFQRPAAHKMALDAVRERLMSDLPPPVRSVGALSSSPSLASVEGP